MEKYEKSFTIRSLWITFIKRWKLIIVVFLSIAVPAIIIINLATPITFTSSCIISKNWSFNSDTYKTITNGFDDDILSNVSKSLKENGVTYSNGNDITQKDLKSGISFSALNTGSNYIAIYYSSFDSAIVINVTNELAKAAVDNFKSKQDMTGLMIYKKASTISKVDNRNKHLMAVIAIDIILSIGIPIALDYFVDAIFDGKDVEILGGDSYEINASKVDRK